MNLRKLIVSLTILAIIAGNIQLAKAQSSEPALTPVFNVPIKEDEVKPAFPSAYMGSIQSLWVSDNALYFLAFYDNVIVKMDLSTKEISKFYEAETGIVFDPSFKYKGFWLIGVNYPPIPSKNEGTHITVPLGAGAIEAVNMTTKETVWSFPTKYPTYPFGMRNDLIYFDVYDEGTYALDLSTRKVRWFYPDFPDNTSSTGKMGFYSHLLVQDTIYATASHVLLAIDSATGKEKFRVNIKEGSLDSLVFKDNILYGTKTGVSENIFNVSYVAFDLSTKNFIWQTYFSSYGFGSLPIITGDSIYVIAMDENGELASYPQRICAFTSSGKFLWRSEYGNFVPKILLNGPYLYAVERVDLDKKQGSRHGFVVINVYDASSGEKVWSYRLSSTDYSGAVQDYWMYINTAYDIALHDNTLILSGFQAIYKEDPGPYAPGTFHIWGFNSDSAESVPEFSRMPLIFSASILALIPLLFSNKVREIGRRNSRC